MEGTLVYEPDSDNEEIFVKYISLTDIAKKFSDVAPSYVIQSWIRSSNTIGFLNLWEQGHNDRYSIDGYEALVAKLKTGTFTMTPKQWIEQTGAIGITSRSGKSGGTYAHPLLVCEFMMWLSPEFKLNLLEWKVDGVGMKDQENIKSTDFIIYYLNFSKVYEIAMMINNVVLTTIARDSSKSYEQQYGFQSSISAQGSKKFLDGIKASISADAKETSFSSTKVAETLDVKTTKSILLRRIIQQCNSTPILSVCSEGDLLKIDNVKLEILDEESLRQFLILRKDALKGFRVEGMEVNNLVGSMLQDYAYILKGTIINGDNKAEELIIKIPLEIQNEFENKYNVNDLIIGHVSIIGVYKEPVPEEFITSNTFTYFQEIGLAQEKSVEKKIIKSGTHQATLQTSKTGKDTESKYHFY